VTVNILLNNFTHRAQPCGALRGDRLDSHRTTIRAFEDAKALGKAALINKAEIRAKVVIFSRGIATLIETRELFGPQKCYIRAMQTTNSLPATAETAIRVPRDHSVSLFV
jgi:hypothetical protein